jgi:uncharacterized protein YggU (UPF0235/DUF167 family)
MVNREFNITDAKGGAAFTVRCVTRATRTEAVGIQEDGALKVRLQATPAGSKEANEELLNFLTEVLAVDKNTIEIVAGLEGRDKLVSVEGVAPAVVNARLNNITVESDSEAEEG